MAINVYMTLFRKYNAQKLKSLEWKYHIMCYGIPFLVAFVYIFTETAEKGRMYGPATVNTSAISRQDVQFANSPFLL